MTERINRRDTMIEVATRLFMEQGYAATSVREIAEAVGCTEAALYYHFKDGKRELLQSVVECNIPELVQAVEDCRSVTSLHDFVICYARAMASKAQKQVHQLRWIAAEFPTLTHEERAPLYEKHAQFRAALRDQIRRFVPDEAEAERLAWQLIFVAFGYGQLMINLDMQAFAEFDLNDFVESLARQIAAGQGEK
jgi:AcrR family transcriptional regulator